MKTIILNYNSNIPEENFNELFQAALNYGMFDIFTDDKYLKKIGNLDRIKLYSNTKTKNLNNLILESPQEDEILKEIEESDGKYQIGSKFLLSSKDDEQKIINLVKKVKNLSFVIVKIEGTNWKVIPFENLIAELSRIDTQLYAEVKSVDEAELLFQTLEKGVDGILFQPDDPNQILDLKSLVGSSNVMDLSTAEILEVKEIPKADRVCVDTTSMLHPGEGMLVGSTAKGFGLVHAEVFDSEFVNSRPFRVNAGDVSAYILVPEYDGEGNINTRTNYLSELKAGDEVVVVDVNGNIRIVTIGRLKIETRPMLLFKMKSRLENGKEIIFHVIIQNAETVRLIKNDKTSIAGTELKKGDKIIVYIGPGATHFGTSIKETIIEK